MKKIKKAAALAACLLIMVQFSGCRSQKNDRKDVVFGKGGYEEHIIEASVNTSGISGLIDNGEKKIIADYFDLSLYSLDNNTFVKEPGNKLASNVIVTSRLLAAKGENYFIEGFDSKTGESGYYIIDAENKPHKIQNTDYIISAGYDKEDDKIVFLANNYLSEINMGNYSVKQLADVGLQIYAMNIIGNKAYVVDENGLHIIDCKSGNAIEPAEPLRDFFNSISVNYDPSGLLYDICGADDNSLYILSSDGIYRYAENGNQIEQLIDGKKYSIGSNTKKTVAIVVNKEGTISVLFDNAEIAEYVYDPDMDNNITSVLKVYSLFKDDSLDQYMNQYLIKNKNVQIDYTTGFREGCTENDAIEDLTVQILSGNAPDLILLDGVDIDNFKDKNILADLSEHESEWKPEGEYLTNIAEWNRDENGLFCVASRFRVPAFGGNRDDISNINNMNDLAEKVEKIRKEEDPAYQIIGFESSDSVAELGLIYEGTGILEPDNINTESFRKFYTGCSKLYKNDLSSDHTISFCLEYCNKTDKYNFIGRYYNSIINKDSFAVGTINSFDNELDFITSADSGNNIYDISYIYGMGNGKKTFAPSGVLGVVDAGKNHEEAYKFIKYVLGSDNQKTQSSEGFPVNCDALKYFYNRADDPSAVQKEHPENISSASIYENGGITDDITVKCINKKKSAEFDAYIKSLDEPVYIDSMTKEIINDSLRKIIFEDADTEQIAEDTVRQLKLKMKE